MTRALKKTEPGYRHEFRIGDVVVALTRMEPRTRTTTLFGETRTSKTEQSLYAVAVDGEDAGVAYKPFGYGRQHFLIDRPGEAHRYNLGEKTVYGRGFVPRADWVLTVEELAVKIAALRKDRSGPLPRLPTVPELERYRTQYRERERQREEEGSMIAEERKAERERVRMAERERVGDVLAGLHSIDERLSGQLTNMELNGLRSAISLVSAELAAIDQQHAG